ncbi:hypothetical protein U1Q18_031718 [Sarracenia purpurea var. burkii]
MDCSKMPPGARNGKKKKQVKDELDRLKQAEKKKRRLEKALATSAAIRSELEKKKQKKKEEQERLDEEGAAIAEAVALHVLLGEDSEESCKIMQDYPNLSGHSLEGIQWVPYGHGSGYKWNNEWENSDFSLLPSPGPFAGDHYVPYSDERGWEVTEISAAGHVAAQAVASLQIAEDERVDSYVLDRMFKRVR